MTVEKNTDTPEQNQDNQPDGNRLFWSNGVSALSAVKAFYQKYTSRLEPKLVDVPAAAVPTGDVDMGFDDDDEPSLFGGQILFILITLFFVIAFYWASVAELDEQVRAEGSIVPPSDVQVVQARLPGLITEIAVELGSNVTEGDVLFRMEDEDVQANFADNEIRIFTAQIALIRLRAEASNASELIFDDRLVALFPNEVLSEQALFVQRQRALRGELDVMTQHRVSLQRSIEEKEATLRVAENQAEIHQAEFDMIKPLIDAGHEPRIKLIEAQRRLAGSQGEAEIAGLSIHSLRSEFVSQTKKIHAAQENFQAEAAAKVSEVQTQLAQAEARKKALAEKVGYAEVRAPHTGTISALHLKTIGAVVQSGAPLAEIVPKETKVTVRAHLQPQDVADVYIGQTARISLSAYDVSRYGSLEGSVSHIASNTTQKEGMPPYYETMIEIGNPVFSKAGITPDAVPGMQVTVDIIGGKRTVMDYILTPIKRATDVAFREK